MNWTEDPQSGVDASSGDLIEFLSYLEDDRVDSPITKKYEVVKEAAEDSNISLEALAGESREEITPKPLVLDKLWQNDFLRNFHIVRCYLSFPRIILLCSIGIEMEDANLCFQ